MIQPPGIANRGRAYIFENQSDFSAISESKRQAMLARAQTAQEKLQKEQAYDQMMPDVSGDVFYGDVEYLRNSGSEMIDLMAQIRANGIDPSDVSNPLVQDFTKAQMAFQYAEGQSKQRQAGFKERLSTYQDKLAKDEVMPGYIEGPLATYLQNYKPGQSDPFPSFSGYESFDMPGYIKKLGDAIDAEQTSQSYASGTTYGTVTTKARRGESIQKAADQALADQKFSRAIETGYQQLPTSDQVDINNRANQNGIDPIRQHARDMLQEYLGANQQSRTTSRVSAATEQGWADRRKAKVLGEAILKQLAGAVTELDPEAKVLFQDGNPARGAGEVSAPNKRFLQGMTFGDTGETVASVTRKGGNLVVVTKTKGTDSTPSQEVVREFSDDRVFDEFLTPVIMGTYGGSGDEVLESIYSTYKDMGGDLGQFKPNVVTGETSLGKKYSTTRPSANDSY